MKKILVIGHRGARAYGPENTIPSYKIALSQGVDLVDIDITVSKDKELIAYHDLFLNPDILNIPNQKSILIKDLTLTQLQNFNVILNKNSNYGHQFLEQQQFTDLKLSTLQEIVDYVNYISNNSVGFQIEIKNNCQQPDWSYPVEELAELIFQFIIRNNLIRRVKVQAFDWRILLKLNQLEPLIKTGYLDSLELRKDWQHWFANTIIIETAKRLNISSLDDIAILHLVKQLGAYSYEPEDNSITIEQIEIAHVLGLKVIVWGYPEHSGLVFNPELMHKLINGGIDGIITDNPLELNKTLSELLYSIPKKFN